MMAAVAEIPGYVAGRWSIDPVHSDVGFVIRHLMVSKVHGHFTTFEGAVVAAADPLDSSVTAVIDLTSVDTSNQRRDDHIRSADFFEVNKFHDRSPNVGAQALTVVCPRSPEGNRR